MSPEPTHVTTDELLAHAAWVRSLARRLVGDAHAAEDVVQETWLAALRRPPQRGRPVEPWLRTVLTHFARRRAAREARWIDREPAPEDGASSPDELLGELELQSTLAREVAQLPEPYRGVVLRRYYRGESSARIARALGLPPATVRSQLARGLSLLRRRMDAHFDGDGEARSRAMLALAGGASGWMPAGALPAALRGLWMMGWTTRVLVSAAAIVAVVGAGLGLRAVIGGDAAAPEEIASVSAAEAPRADEPVARSAAPDMDEPGVRAALSDEATAEEPEARATAAEPAYVVLARVVDEDGLALEQARIGSGEGSRERSAEAGGDGHVELRIPTRDVPRYEGQGAFAWLTVSASDHATRFVGARLEEDGPTDLGELVLAPGGRISGRVHDAMGAPVAGARVLATGSALGVSPEEITRTGPEVHLGAPETTTGADGRFVVSGVPVGEARVFANAPGTRWSFSSPLQVRAAMETRDVELVLAPLAPDDTIEGLVLAPDGTPLERGHIRCTWRTSFHSARVAARVEDGRFRFVVTRKEPHDLCAYDEDGRHTPAVLHDVEPGARGLVLQLTEERRIDVLVRDRDGVAIRGARLRTEDLDELSLDPNEWPRSDESGRASVRVPAELFLLHVEADGCARATFGPYEPARVPDELEAVLERLPGLRGRVLADGRPLDGAEVFLHPLARPREEVVHRGFPMRMDPEDDARATTDELGDYVLVAPRAGEYVVIARAPGRAPAESAPVTIDPQRGAVAPDLVLGLGGTIEGQVLVPAGRERAGLVVAASRGDGELRVERTDAEGRYRFEQLTQGPWQVLQLAHEPRLTTRFAGAREPLEIEWTCRVGEGQVTRHTIDLREVAQAQLAGRLLLDGAGAAGWIATLRHAYAAEVLEPVRPVGLDTDGGFRLAVPPGPYDLTLTSPAEAGAHLALRARVQLDEGETAWERALDTAPVRGGFTEPGVGTVLMRWEGEGDLQATVQLAPDATGAFDLGRLPAGSWRIDAMRDEGGAIRWVRLRELTLEPGAAVELELP